MNWLIVEDALKDRWGHFLEYDTNFFQGVRALGDEVILLCDRTAEDYVVSSLDARPVLPRSIWHRMSDRAGPFRRYMRLPVHALATFFALRRHFAKDQRVPLPSRDSESVSEPESDLIFVPTLLVHHLLGWYLLLKFGNCPPDARILLFFPNLPLRMDASGNANWNGSPSTRLMAWLFQQMRPLVEERRVILGVETEAMQQSLAQLTGMPVVYLPHPIEPLPTNEVRSARTTGDALLFACYGTARAEKGSDVLQSAIERMFSNNGGHSTRAAEDRASGCPELRFAIQWIDNFVGEDGKTVEISKELLDSGKVDYIRRYFVGDEYERRLRQTDVMVLPYLASSYNVRVSRIVIEAMVHGVPVIASDGTTVWSQAREFGAGMCFKEGDTASLENAMRHLALNFDDYSKKADQAVERARDHFSVRSFRQLYLDYIKADCLVIGDSHVARWNWAALDASMWSYGISGATSGGLLEILSRSRIQQPRSVMIWIGTNDLLQGVPITTVLGNIRRIVGFFSEAVTAKRVGIAELLPLKIQFPSKGASHGGLREMNEKLEALTRELGIQWIPFTDRVMDPDGFPDDGLAADGNHLNTAGYQKISAGFRQHCAWLSPTNSRAPGDLASARIPIHLPAASPLPFSNAI